jgi:4-hydroxy-2-oxoheptanedioate aldolase
MIINKTREKILKGENVVGAFSCAGSSAVIECMGLAGLDFVIIDTEHGPADVESTVPLILAAERRNVTPIVRVKDATRSSVLKMLDIGAMGLLVPFVKSLDEVKRVIEYGKYIPTGQRGFGPGRISGFGLLPEFKSVADYFETCNRETLIIPQCETVEALECIEEIAELEGVDGIFVGPFYLSIAMGKPLQFNDPEFISAVERTVKAFRDAGKLCLTYAATGGAAKDNFAKGFHGSAFYDVSALVAAFSEFVKDAQK